MSQFILDYYYLILSITIILIFALIGYIKENKNLKEVSVVSSNKEDISVSNVSISDLDSNIDSLT